MAGPFSDPAALTYAGHLLTGVGQPAGFAPSLGRALLAGGETTAAMQRRAALDAEQRAQEQQMQMQLLKYQSATAEAAAKMRAEAEKKRQSEELRPYLESDALQELYDVDPKRALDMTPQFADPGSRFRNVGSNQVVDLLAAGGPGKAYEVEQTIDPAEAERIRLAEERLQFDRDKEAYDQQSGGPETTSAMRLRAVKRADAMRLYGISEGDANAVVDGFAQIITDPVSGKSTLVNKATQETRPIDRKVPPVERIPVPEDEPQRVSVEDIAGESGIGAVAVDAWDRIVGQLPVVGKDLISTERARAQTATANLKQQAISAFSLSSRPPVVEQERILDMIGNAVALESPPRKLAVLQETGRMAVDLHNQYAGMIEGGGLTADQQNEMQLKMIELKRFASSLGALPNQQAKQQEAVAPKADDKPVAVAPQQAATQQPPKDPLGTAPTPELQKRTTAQKADWPSILETARKYNMTPEQVLERLEGGGG